MGSSVEQNILVTGGAGFIGTHTVVQLLKEGFKVSIIDNLDNSVIEAVDRVRELVGPDLSKKLEFTQVTLLIFLDNLIKVLPLWLKSLLCYCISVWIALFCDFLKNVFSLWYLLTSPSSNIFRIVVVS